MIHTYFPRTIADLQPGDHLCCLYETEEEHRAVLTPFLRQGLERGEKVIYIVDTRTAEAILGYLQDNGLEVEPYLASGQLAILTHHNACMREGIFDPEGMIALLRAETERALAQGYPALRVTGEMTWALRGLPGSERLIEYEARLNEFFPGSKCLAICQYDRRRFDLAVLLDVLRTHPVAVIGTEVYDNFYHIPPAELLGHDLPAAKLRQWVRNLAERKRAEEALQNGEERYRALFEGVPVGLYRTTPDGQILDVNLALVKILGYPDRETILMVNAADGYANPEDRARWQALMDRERVVRDFEAQWRRHDGTIIWVKDTARAVRDADGRVLYYEGTVENVTERKRAEEALQESRRRLENRERFITNILESVPTSLVVIDRSLRVVSVNRNFLEKTRREEQATLSRKVEEVFPQVLLKYTRLDEKVQEIFRTGKPVEGGKFAYRAPSLPTRTYYYRLIPLSLSPRPGEVEGGVENVMLLMDDITEREKLGEEVRRAERHLASVVDSAYDLVASMDAEARILTWNRAAERTSGFRPEEVKGQYLPGLCVEEDQQKMKSWLMQLTRGQFAKKSIEINLRTKGGEEVPISWVGSRMLNDERRTVGLVAVGRDLTERKRLEAQLIQSAKLTSLGVMAGGIAHEIRNPLAISSAAAQLLLERPEDEELREGAVKRIHSGIQRASYIIENLLKFARPPEERMVSMDIDEALEETLSLLANQLKVQQVELRKDLAPDLLPVVGNKSLLEQVFSNMILNACNAMPEGGTLTVATLATKAGVEIRFADTGVGVPPEHMVAIFDPFFTTMPVGKGTGLGLSISYSIIQQHQGTIEVESREGQGSTFIVRLPVTPGSK